MALQISDVAPRQRSLLFSETRIPEAAQLLRRRFYTIAMLGSLGLAGALAYLYVTPPRYTAEAVLAFGPADGQLAATDATGTGLKPGAAERVDFATVRTQVQVLETWSIAAQAVEKLELVEHPRHEGGPSVLNDALKWLSDVEERAERWLGVDPHAAPAAMYNRLLATIDKFRRGLSVVTDGRSYIVEVRYRSIDPRFAAEAANTLAEVYLGDQLDYKSATVGQLSRWLSRRTDEARGRLHESESALQVYRQQHNLPDAKGVTVSQQQLGELNSQLVIATADLAQREATAHTLKEIARGGARIDAAPEVLASPLIHMLRDQEAQLASKASEIAGRYGEKHPATQSIRAEMAGLHQKIAAEIGKIAESVDSQAAVARAHVRSLRTAIDGLQRTVSDASIVDVRLHELEQQVEAGRSELNGYLSLATEAVNRELLVRSDARLVSPAIEPPKPSWPLVPVVIVIGLGGGVLIGLLLGVWRDRIDDTARGLAQIEGIVGVPCLGLLPRRSRRRIADDIGMHEVLERPNSLFSEAIRSIVATFEPVGGQDLPRVVLVTSVLPDVGKTSLSLALARSAAKAGYQVLLVDCNLRRPKVSHMLKYEDCDGLDAVIAGRELSDNPIRTDDRSGLHVLPTRPARDVHDLLASPTLSALVDEARRHYDLIVLDGPALMQGPDTMILSRLIDLGLVIVPWRRTRVNALLRALQRLEMPSGRKFATVLSEVPVNRYLRYLHGRAM